MPLQTAVHSQLLALPAQPSGLSGLPGWPPAPALPLPCLSPPPTASPHATSALQKAKKAGVYALYSKPWPRYVECSTQGAFVMPCNTGLNWNGE